MIDNNIKDCREDMDMTQKELGYIFGVHESTISGWETGKDTIPLTKLVRFCNLYHHSLDYVIGLTRENKKYNEITKIDKKKIGIKLKNWRKINNLTQEQVAKEFMISQTSYGNYERGCYLINSLTLYSICKKYGLSMDEFLSRKLK